MPIPHRNGSFHGNAMRRLRVRGIRPRFRGLSPCAGQVAYVLLTSAPVAAGRIAAPALPLDLHVLSLSLAFILSQDQTLRCCILVFFSLQEKRPERHEAQGNVVRRDDDEPTRPQDHARFTAVCILTCPELDMELGFPSLSLALSISSSDCKHFKDRATLFFGVKKIAHSILHLVRRNRCKVTATFPNAQAFRRFFSPAPRFFSPGPLSRVCGCKGTTFFRTAKTFRHFFSKKTHFPVFSATTGRKNGPEQGKTAQKPPETVVSQKKANIRAQAHPRPAARTPKGTPSRRAHTNRPTGHITARPRTMSQPGSSIYILYNKVEMGDIWRNFVILRYENEIFDDGGSAGACRMQNNEYRNPTPTRSDRPHRRGDCILSTIHQH